MAAFPKTHLSTDGVRKQLFREHNRLLLHRRCRVAVFIDFREGKNANMLPWRSLLSDVHKLMGD